MVVDKVALPETASLEEVLGVVEDLNGDSSVHGIIVQMPLPEGMDSDRVVQSIEGDKDVDGFTLDNVGRLGQRAGEAKYTPCTAAGVMKLLEEYGVDVKGKTAVVVGRSDIVGMPVFQMLTKAGATVTLCHTNTR